MSNNGKSGLRYILYREITETTVTTARIQPLLDEGNLGGSGVAVPWCHEKRGAVFTTTLPRTQRTEADVTDK